MEAAGAAASAEDAVERLSAAMAAIGGISDFPNPLRKMFLSLSRRIRLLQPLVEEARELTPPPPKAASLASLADAVTAAVELLRLGAAGSKIFLVLQSDKVIKKLQDVTSKLEEALASISFEGLDVSDEVREQVELVHTLFKRAKERVDTIDTELYKDYLSAYNNSADANVDSTVLHRLAEKLQLLTMSDLKQESLALKEQAMFSNWDASEDMEKMSMLLKTIKDFVQTQDPEMGSSSPTSPLSKEKGKATVIPDDFRCPISLDLMKDPVIVATGQTYERGCIEKWLEAGHDTCPKTQQRLSSKSLTPNFVLRSLIAQWCEANGVEAPTRPTQQNSTPSTCCATEHGKVMELLQLLSSQNLEDQRAAACKLRQLAKRNAENRACIGEANAIPLLVSLLTSADVTAQEHAVTALLNLSIYEENKGRIIMSGAVPGIIHVLKRGSMEARENAAATLFSLSLVDENKVTIGTSGAIPPLVALLSNGSPRGKKDAATALFNLCIYQGNKGKAVRAGLIPILMQLLLEPESGMVDEALAILAILSSHPEGKAAIGAAAAVPVLVEVIRSGSPRNKENAAAVLVHLCNCEQQQPHLIEAQEQGLTTLLEDLAQSGTDRGKRKAIQLLERIDRVLKQQSQVQAQAEAVVQSQIQVQPQALAEAQAEEERPSLLAASSFLDR